MSLSQNGRIKLPVYSHKNKNIFLIKIIYLAQIYRLPMYLQLTYILYTYIFI